MLAITRLAPCIAQFATTPVTGRMHADCTMQLHGPSDEKALNSELLFKGLLLVVAIGYGSNFPVGRLMNEDLPASAVTSGRFALAAIALSPFIPRLKPALIGPALLTGLCDSLGYCAQSIALVDTPAAKVSFLGALTVVIVPCLEAAFDGRRLGFVSAPQVWLAAGLVLAGVGFLELGGSAEALTGGVAPGDIWALIQACGFATSFWLIGRLIGGDATAGGDDSSADQVLPLTAINIATVAMIAACWAVADGCGLGPLAGSSTAGWLLDEPSRTAFTLPGALLGPVGLGILWSGLATTALVRIGETAGLSRVRQSDAAIIIATEPLWAALFGLLLLGESLGRNGLVGGILVVCACLVSSADAQAMRDLLRLTPSVVEPKEDETRADRRRN